MGSNQPTFVAPFTNGIQQSPATTSWSNLTPTQSTPRSAAGRKRSRDEAAPNLEEDYFAVQAPIVQPEPENEDDWEYGEGMVLIKKRGKEYIADSSSQTQDCAEEKAAEGKAKASVIAAAAAAERPVIRAAKSQRLNLSSTPAIPEETLSNGVAASPGSPERHTEPTVDDFTRHLGIGWSSMYNAGPDIQAAARGWAKFIENHFPVTNVKIQLTSKSLESYLIEANEGYFLFGEDLRQGRLVSTSLEKTWVNLRGPVPVFDGDLVMEAGQTPEVEAGVQPVDGDNTMNGLHVVGVANGMNPPIVNGAHVMDGMVNGCIGDDMNGANGPCAQTMEVEMDMS